MKSKGMGILGLMDLTQQEEEEEEKEIRKDIGILGIGSWKLRQHSIFGRQHSVKYWKWEYFYKVETKFVISDPNQSFEIFEIVKLTNNNIKFKQLKSDIHRKLYFDNCQNLIRR